jgi:hypothetical protein
MAPEHPDDSNGSLAGKSRDLARKLGENVRSLGSGGRLVTVDRVPAAEATADLGGESP